MPTTAPVTTASTPSAPTTTSDYDLQSVILGRLDRDSSVEAAEVGVLVQDGVVTLCGVVDTIAQRHAAVRAAIGARDVVHVEDELLVHMDPRADDVTTTKLVTRALWDDRAVRTAAIRVAMRDGVVTLTGTAWSDVQRAAACHVVEHLENVRAVDCRLEVVLPAPDASAGGPRRGGRDARGPVITP